MSARWQNQRGVSLVELAVGLSIAALLTVVLMTVLPIGGELAGGERRLRELAEADEALLGHLRAHDRLPTADANGDGRADAGATSGWLPVTDLGLPARLRIRYHVAPELATAPGDLFRPFLPPDYRNQLAVTGNGLDMCMQLMLNQRDGVSIAGLDVPVAYHLGHSGAPGHDADAFDTAWSAGARPLPGSAGATALTLATGPGELAARLACPDRLARAQGGAQAAYAAYSAMRVTDFNREFREFDVKIAELVAERALTLRNLAIYYLADAISSEAVAIVLTAAGWPPNKPGIVAGGKWLAGKMAGSTLSLGLAIKGIVDTEADLKAANEDLDRRRNNLGVVTAQRDRTQTLYVAANGQALLLDRGGLAR